MTPKARCFDIVGNSKFYDTMLPVEEIYAALFEDVVDGFNDVIVLDIRGKPATFNWVNWI